MRNLVLDKGYPNVLVCALYKQFPPPFHSSDRTPEDLLKSGKLTQIGYSHFKIWQKVCGLHKMDEGKCRSCPHCRTLEDRDGNIHMVSMDGKFRTPFLDLETLGMLRTKLAVRSVTPTARTDLKPNTPARPGNRGMT